MRTTLLICGFSLCQGLALSAPELDETVAHSFYFSVSPGAAWMQDISYRDDAGSGKLKFNPGPRLDLAAGYNFTESLAVEMETGALFLFNSSERDTGFEQVQEDLLQVPIMAGVRFQPPLTPRFRPFLGVGVGGVYTALYDQEWIGVSSAGDDFTFGYQGFAGVSYQISRQLALGLEYRFMGTLEHNFGQLHLGETRSHCLAVSISLRL